MKVTILSAHSVEIVDNDGNRFLQDYESMIVKITPKRQVILDEVYWNYSITTSKARNAFLGDTTKTTQAKIKSGEYKLENLN